MSYVIGHCSDCKHTMVVTDTTGKIVARKKNYGEADLVYADGTRVRCQLCQHCQKNPKYSEIIDNVCDKGSQAGDLVLKKMVKDKGIPISIIKRI